MTRAKASQAAKEPPGGLVKVTAVHPYQIGHQGAIAGPGEALEVPAELAERWRAQGLVE